VKQSDSTIMHTVNDFVFHNVSRDIYSGGTDMGAFSTFTYGSRKKSDINGRFPSLWEHRIK